MTCAKPNPPVQACATNSGPFCANLQTDPNFCGACNTTCPSDSNARGVRSCKAGVCGITCDRNFPDQCGDPAQGVSLCVNTKSSITNWCASPQFPAKLSALQWCADPYLGP